MAGLFFQHLKAHYYREKAIAFTLACLLLYLYLSFLNGGIAKFSLLQRRSAIANNTLGVRLGCTEKVADS